MKDKESHKDRMITQKWGKFQQWHLEKKNYMKIEFHLARNRTSQNSPLITQKKTEYESKQCLVNRRNERNVKLFTIIFVKNNEKKNTVINHKKEMS